MTTDKIEKNRFKKYEMRKSIRGIHAVDSKYTIIKVNFMQHY